MTKQTKGFCAGSASLVIAALALVALTGCTAIVPNANTEPSVTSSPNSSASGTKSPEESLAELAEIANDSCEKAQAVGTVQTAEGITLVMVPKSQAIEGFSAAYASGDSQEVIYESDAFYACTLSNTVSMATEAGISFAELTQGEDPILVTLKTSSGNSSTWNVETSAGTLKGKPVRVLDTYAVVDGLIVEVVYHDQQTNDETVSSIRYGVTDSDRAIIAAAVDALED